MSRYSLYTAVRRRGGAPGRPLHRSAPPGSARSRSRAESYVCVRRVCAVGVRPLVAPSLGIRANSGLSSGRCRARAARSGRGYLYGLYARGRNGRDACNGRVGGPQLPGCDGVAVGGGYGGLSPIPDSGYRKKKVHTQPHCASRRTTLFSPPVGNDVPRPAPPDRATPRAQMSIASSLSHLEPNRTSLASTVTPGVLFSFLRNKRLASSLSP